MRQERDSCSAVSGRSGALANAVGSAVRPPESA